MLEGAIVTTVFFYLEMLELIVQPRNQGLSCIYAYIFRGSSSV